MSSLYDLTGEFKALYELAINDEDPQAFLDTLEGLKGELAVKAGGFNLKISKNGGVQPMKITGEVPDSFTKVIVEPDNQKIRDALVNGEALEFAHLEERGRHLNIK